MKYVYSLIILLSIVVPISFQSLAHALNEPVIFQSTNIDGKTQALNGYIYKPEGEGPFAAIILLHGCSGVNTHHHNYAMLLKKWGYVALIVDSLNPRGVGNICNVFKVYPIERAFDVYGTAKYLQRLPYVSGKKIGILGFSHGGTTGLKVVERTLWFKKEIPPVKAAVLYYPGCYTTAENIITTPTLILIGEKDDWTFSHRCADMENELTNPDIVELVVYKNATHGFNVPVDIEYLGHKIKYNAEADENAKEKTRAFFDRHLLGK